MKKLILFIIIINLLLTNPLLADNKAQPHKKKLASPPSISPKKRKRKISNRNVSLNFADIEIRNLIDIISKVTGENFIFEEKLLKGKKVTLVSQKKYTSKEAYRIFQSVLEINDLTTLKEGTLTRIIAKREARNTPTSLVKKERYHTKGNEYITAIIPVVHSSANNIRSTLALLLSRDALLQVDKDSNLLILRDTKKNVIQFKKIVNILDKDVSSEFKIFVLKNTDADTITNILNRIFSQKNNNNFKPLFISDRQTGRIIVIATLSVMKKAEEIIEKLDLPVHFKLKISLISLEHTSAKTIAPILKKVYSKSDKKGSSSESSFNIIPIEHSNQLLIIGNNQFIENVKSMLAEIDVANSNSVLEFISLKHAIAKDASTLLTNIFKSFQQSQGSGSNIIQFYADERTNNLIIKATSSSIKTIKMLITHLDQPADMSTTGNFKVYSLNNAKAEDLSQVLQKITQSFQGSNSGAKKNINNDIKVNIIPDKATNSLVIFAGKTQFPILEKVISDLDVIRPQVYVEALIMEISLDKSLDLGIEWEVSKNSSVNGNDMVVTGGTNSKGQPSEFLSTNGSGQLGFIGTPISFAGETFNSFTAFIKAKQSDTEIDILANPKILTLNNEEAEIKVGENRAFPKDQYIETTGRQRTSYEYKDIGITLKITPQISSNNTIQLKIDQATKEVSPNAEGAGDTIVTLDRTIKTSVITNDGNTVVLGGLINDKITTTSVKTPCLGDIPFLGWLFKYTSSSTKKSNLLVFLTPRIIRTKKDLEKLSRSEIKKSSSAKEGSFRLNIAKEIQIPALIKDQKQRKKIESKDWEIQND